MSAVLLSVFSAVWLASTSVAEPSGAEQLEARVYAIPWGETVDAGRLKNVMVQSVPLWCGDEGGDSVGQAEWDRTVDGVSDWIRLLIHPEVWDQEGVVLEQTRKTLTVVAPATSHQEIAEFLGFLELALVPNSRIQVTLYEGTTAESAAVVDSSVADSLLQEGVTSGRLRQVRRGSVGLRPGRVMKIEDAEVFPVVWNWDVEIAQGSNQSDSRYQHVLSGLRTYLRSSVTAEGVVVDSLIRASHVQSTKVHKLDVKASVLTSREVELSPFLGLFQFPRMGFGSWQGSVHLPHGKVALLPAQIETAAGLVAFLVEMRVLGEVPSPVATYSGEEGRVFHLVDAVAAVHGGVLPSTVPWREMEGGYHTAERQPVFLENSGRLNVGYVDLLRTLFHELEDEPGAWLETNSGRLLSVVPERISTPFTQAATELARPGTSWQVRAVLRKGDKEVGRGTIPLVSGFRGYLAAGSQTYFLRDWWVDVASNSGSPSPDVAPLFDGYEIQLFAEETSGDDLWLNVDASVHLLQGEPTEVSLETVDGRVVEQYRADQYEFKDSRRVRPGEWFRYGGPGVSLEFMVEAL